MDHGRPNLKMRVVLTALLLVVTTGPLVLVGMPSIGWKTISFGAANDVGPSTDDVRSVALGDLDDDGNLDLPSGSASAEDYEVIAWENDGTPFSGLWSQNDVGASTASVRTIAVGDLDNDGDLDIVSGSYSGEDYEVIAWENDGSPCSRPREPRALASTTTAVEVSTWVKAKTL